MRTYLKRQCIDTLDVLIEAHEQIASLIAKGDIMTASDLLGQCQQGAITVGTTIEDSEGEGTAEVALLEEYCEAVYKLSLEIETKDISNAKRTIKHFDKLINRIISGINNNIVTSKEVVFLPYKASMWNSLEMIYEEACADPDTDAYIVPIPYFDKNPDGSFGDMHYEYDEYDKDLNLIRYTNYNIEARRPDEIYIHNPYDDKNHITTVHPDYYSSRLCELTPCLIYVPYFVLPDIDFDKADALKSVEHFVITNAMKYVSLVYVWSDEYRRAYIDIMSRFVGEDTRQYWEDIIKVHESSKLKRIANLRESDYDLPPEWADKIIRSDGTKRKVIFYNIGVDPLLKQNDKMIDKIERVLDIFYDNREDVVLLFRPHPLIEATLTSMRPDLWERYKKIIDRYISDNWGIYDDSAKLERAIAVSDAYYGDHSSVVVMYQETSKPIMIQNCDV